MAISLLNNISALEAQNQLQSTQSKLQNTLFQLSSGSRINSGADDAAGLAIANGLQANITALTQSQQNATSGVGSLQVADGALAQITTLLNRAVTLATEGSTSTVSDAQRVALQAEYSQINTEIDSIGSSTNFNGTAVFTNSAQNVFLSDGVSNSTINTSTELISSAALGLTAGNVVTSAAATKASGTVNLLGQPNSGDTFTINTGANHVFTFTTAVAQAGDVKIGSSVNQTLINLADAMNHSGGTNGVGGTYDTAGAVPNVTAAVNGSALSITASATGAGGNAYTLADTSTTGNWDLSGATLAGGAAAGANVTTAVTNTLSTAANAQATLGLINSAIAGVASERGAIGAYINRLQAASNVESNQVQNLTSAEDNIMAANIPQQVTNLSEFSILNQSGISALAQANSSQQSILKLLQ